MSELARRALVAVIGAPIAVWLIWLGDAPLATFAAVLSAIACWEFFRIARAAGSDPLTHVGIATSALLPIAVHAQFLGVIRVPVVAGSLLVLGVIGLSIWLRGVQGRPIAAA